MRRQRLFESEATLSSEVVGAIEEAVDELWESLTKLVVRKSQRRVDDNVRARGVPLSAQSRRRLAADLRAAFESNKMVAAVVDAIADDRGLLDAVADWTLDAETEMDNS